MSFNILNIPSQALHLSWMQVETISNNIANANSSGYKKARVNTTDLFYKNIQSSGIQENEEYAIRPSGINIGSGVKLSSMHRDFSVGDVQQTNRKLDIFIAGQGFIPVNLPNNTRGYTRNGSLSIDNESGLLIDSEGRVLSANIAVPEGSIRENIMIQSDGKVQYKDPTNDTIEELGTIEIFTFNNLDGLEPIGSNIFLATEASGEEIAAVPEAYKIKQGYLESSNVKIFEELVEMIKSQRLYEINTRIIRIIDEISKETNSIKS